MRSQSSGLSWLSTPQLLLIALILCVVAGLIGGYPTVQFARLAFIEAMHPIAEFDANTDFQLVLPDANTRYVVAVSSEAENDPITWVNFTLSSDGKPVEFEESNGWLSIMGRGHKHLIAFDAPSSLALEITAQAEETGDFIVFRHHQDAVDFRMAQAIPWWIGAAIPLVGAVVLVLIVLVRVVSKSDDLEVEF